MKSCMVVTSFCLMALLSGLARAEDSPEATVRKRFDAVVHHDVDAIAALYDVNAVETSPAFCAPRQGPAGARKTYGDLFRDIPAVEDEVTNLVVEGNRVAVQFTVRVRNANGSVAFEAPLANFITVEHGRITRDDTYFDAKGRPCA